MKAWNVGFCMLVQRCRLVNFCLCGASTHWSALCEQTDKRTSKPKVWIYKDKNSGVPKGEATITFDDPETAKAAIDWFDGKTTAEPTYSQLPVVLEVRVRMGKS